MAIQLKRLCVLLLLTFGQNHLCQAGFIPRDFEARRVTTPLTLDGRLNEPAWDAAQEITEFFAYQSGGDPPAAETSAKILWDSQNLYVAFKMKDNDIRPSSLTANQTGRDAQLFRGDVIELFIRENSNSPRYYEFEWSPNQNDLFDARFDNQRFGAPGSSWNTDVHWAVSVDGTIDDITDQDVGWTVEASIPLSAFDSVTTGSEWTFTVARYDYFNPAGASEQLMMLTPGDPDLPQAGLTSGFHTYELYDNLTFVPEPHSLTLASLGILSMLLSRKSRKQS